MMYKKVQKYNLKNTIKSFIKFIQIMLVMFFK